MSTIKILNLYACLGGNRAKWDDISNNLDITAVELDPEAARLYKERFPIDTIIVGDAHQYLLEHYNEYDFIWSSPPCPSHSRSRFARRNSTTPVYPDLKLYEEILFLQNYFKGKFCVENVIPYYQPLIPGQKRGRHLYWTNFLLPKILSTRNCSIMEGKDELRRWSIYHEYDFKQYKGEQSTQKMARNLVDYEAGKTILETALGILNKKKDKQLQLFI